MTPHDLPRGIIGADSPDVGIRGNRASVHRQAASRLSSSSPSISVNIYADADHVLEIRNPGTPPPGLFFHVRVQHASASVHCFPWSIRGPRIDARNRQAPFSLGIITTSIAHDSFKSYMHHPNSAATGAIVATFVAGEAIGAILMVFIGDKLGRKRFMQLGCLIVTVGTVIQTAAQNFGMFLAGRIITGIAVGGLVATVPIYNSEISPPETRGLIAGLSGYMIGIGGFLANWVGYACGFAPYGQFQWRFPLAIQIPPGIVLFAGLLFFFPDSPRWLISVGRDDEARAAFKSVRGDLNQSELDIDFELMKDQILFEKHHEVASFAEAWDKYKRRVIIAIAVQTLTSLSGVNVINYYQTMLYEKLGITGQTVLLLAAIYGSIGIVINILSLYLVDRSGRVKLLGYGCAGLCVDLIYSAIMAHYFADSKNHIGQDFAILGIYMYTAIYYLYGADLTINSTTWLYGVEVLPVSLRSRVTAIASLSHFVFNIAITEAGPSAFANIGENYYYVFVATTFVAAIGVFLYFPETKGKGLEAIAAAFGDKVVTAEEAFEAARKEREAKKHDAEPTQEMIEDPVNGEPDEEVQ
ncbi:hypothetical protein FISHEDRAFT_55630 [Fistulina hepatica ATCC 64428]|uniref:Major facilitator superfamily (MFS) profile domain-containing protein n=1 Tax=Fistulina hepatica ATCC 64428 TaxID=1128425 RepID=A0A0D7AQB6_9AGAR|nr:hypothetical protein FISHEDRAFT_55630 [Fistulina hepatica ATCC 64428]